MCSSDLQIQATGSGVIGAVVRWNDPETDDVAIDNIFSPTEVDAVPLPDLPEDGSIIYAVGEITDAAMVSSESSESGTSDVEVTDTDRWLLDLTDRGSSETVTLAVWIERHFAGTDGSMGPDDPWIAVVPREYVPEPTYDGTYRDATCPDGLAFQFPTTLLEYLVSQLYLSSTMYTGDEDSFDPCGTMSTDPTTCADDWDRDGVLDEDEPQPDSFLGQVRVMECTLNGTVAPTEWEVDSSWLDADEIDDDDLPTTDLLNNTGGYSGTTGEEGYVQVDLEGGREYLIIVAANNGGSGVYELNMRQVE